MSKILVIEDDQTLREMYVQILETAGFVTEVALDGEEAFLKTKTFMPDIILLDLFIPKINGMDILKKIKSDAQTKNIKVIISTNVHVNKEELLQNGAAYVIIKADYNPAQLVQKIQEILGTSNLE